MIKLKEVVEKYQDYGVDEEKLKEILIKPTPKNVWELDFGDVYYLIGTDGSILKKRWNNANLELSRRENGNVFLTEEEAEFEVKRRQIETILLRYGRRSFKYNKNNYFIAYNYSLHNMGYDYIGYDCSASAQYQGIIYFDTKEIWKKAIEEAGEENIKKYLFGVDEDD